MTNYSRSVLKSNGLPRPKIRLKKFGFSLKIVPANIAKKLPLQLRPRPLFIASFNFSHKRRNVRFKRLRRVHTPPQPRTAHTTAHRAKHGAISPSATAWLCAVSEIATERTAGESGCTPYGVCPLSPASRPRWAAQSGRCCFRSRERFSLAVFVLTVSSPAPAAVPVLLETAVRSRGDSCRSAVDSIPPSCAAGHPALRR